MISCTSIISFITCILVSLLSLTYHSSICFPFIIYLSFSTLLFSPYTFLYSLVLSIFLFSSSLQLPYPCIYVSLVSYHPSSPSDETFLTLLYPLFHQWRKHVMLPPRASRKKTSSCYLQKWTEKLRKQEKSYRPGAMFLISRLEEMS